jgi:polyribonucleotide nucleotidyltransferase
MLGASAALALSGIPFKGPIGAARVGYANGKYLLNPGFKDTKASQLDLVVAGTQDAVLMVESEAQMLSESVMLGAVVYGHEQMQAAIKAIRELAAKAAKPAWDWKATEVDAELAQGRVQHGRCGAREGLPRSSRSRRVTRAWARSRRRSSKALAGGETPKYDARAVSDELGRLEYAIVRRRIIDGKPAHRRPRHAHGAQDHG